MSRIRLAVFAVFLLLAAGCVTTRIEPDTQVVMDTPSQLSGIPAGSTVQIISLDRGNNCRYASADKLRTRLEELMKKVQETAPEHAFRIVSGNTANADYLMNVDLFCSYRQDSTADTRFNTVTLKQEKEITNSNGEPINGYEYLVTETTKSATGSFIASVSIYERKNLIPIGYFNVIAYDTSTTPQNGKPAEATVLLGQLGQQVVAKVKDMVNRDKKPVGAFMPERSNENLKKMVLSGPTPTLLSKISSLLPMEPASIPAKLNLEYYNSLKLANEERRKKGEKDVIDRSMELDLSNYYLFLTVKEALDVSPSSILEVFEGHSRILGLTADDGLVRASAHALGRLEVNARRLGIKLGDSGTELALNELSPEELVQHAEEITTAETVPISPSVKLANTGEQPSTKSQKRSKKK
ncbi:hypothetical protein [Trichlorobacter ammonificans]|uniref:Lipoprotein n=1 Tax=Trichlorobacter ammonificans TaxID=2916410 RepID=A0ABM9DAP3_9BACT|nr:hypothetical protein [Trichlorobacter ammonificans]CAH2031433.1 conserved exported protein of unknown function [Trichlorobacter ammonificans]